MTEYRKARTDEQEAYLDLANYVFNYTYGEHDFEKQCPKVYSPNVDSSRMHRVAVDENGKIRGSIALLTDEAKVCGVTLKTGYIGTVCVHPKSRGEGHMKRIMADWQKEMEDEGYDLAILTGQRQRYAYYGYVMGGTSVKYTINPTNIRHALRDVDVSGLSFAPLFETHGWREHALALNNSRPFHVNRENRPLEDVLVTFCHSALAVMKGTKRIGYLVVRTKTGDISEIGLDTPEILPAVIKAYIAFSQKEEIEITVPEYDIFANDCLSSFAEKESFTSSGNYNIINYANVLRAYLTLKNEKIPISHGEFQAVLNGQSVTATVSENGVTVTEEAGDGAIRLDKADADKLLLTRHGQSIEVSVPKDWFPLPIFWFMPDTF